MVPAPPPDPDAEGNIGVLLDPNWFRVVIMKCTANVHEGKASVTLDRWQGIWSFLPNEFVESALRASSGLQIQHLILKQHHLSRLPVNFSALQTGLPFSLSTLDLSHNQFTTLPVVVCDLRALTELYLNHNCISQLPNQIAHLEKLETLQLQGNRLPVLPACVCFLASLKSLNAEDNEIKTISSEIRHLKQLKTLHLKCNKITHLPETFTELPNLEELHLSNNELKCLFGVLPSLLRQLHLANNELRTLPASFMNMQLQGLTLSNNPLKFPPMSVCRQGPAHIKTYMEEWFRREVEKPISINPYYNSDGDDTEYEDIQ